MTLTKDTTVGRIATEHPLATRVFHRHGIDFCCGGGKPLHEACADRSVDLDRVLAEIDQEVNASPAPEKRWDQAPLPDVIDHLLYSYHRPLDEELPRLDGMAQKVLDVHGDKDPNLAEIRKLFGGLKAELEQHMMKEEQVLFPMIMQGQGRMTGGPISVMEMEHENAGGALRRLRELTNDYTVPEAACNTWRALWHGLDAFEQSLHEHIHLENNILFPRAQAE